MKKIFPILLGVGVIVIICLGLWYNYRKTSSPADIATSTPPFLLTDEISVVLPDGATAVLLPISDELVPPSLDQLIYIDASVEKEAAQKFRDKQLELIQELKNNPTKVDLWLLLGLYQKASLNYREAEKSWVYVSQTAPTDISAIAFGNLGDLYQNFLYDYESAEEAYKQAIKRTPNQIDYYRNLITLYRYQYKVGTGADISVLEQGLTANPGNSDLLQLQADMGLN
jgi:tetratricopeptide (TPR) repeat protein